MRLSYIIQREERASGSAPPNRDSIRQSKVSTLIPAFNNSIICSTLNPACSPARVSLNTLAATDGVAIFTSQSSTVWNVDVEVSDPRHSRKMQPSGVCLMTA